MTEAQSGSAATPNHAPDPDADSPRPGPIVEHGSPSWASTVLYVLARLLLKPTYRVWPLTDSGIRALRFIERIAAALPPPTGVGLDTVDLAGISAELTVPRSGATDALAGVTVLYLHGGGFLFCGPATHRRVCARLATSLGVRVYSLNYRQLPEAGVGTSVQDAYRGYHALLAAVDEPDKIIVAGDSAGGFLAAKICELAHLDKTTAPSALVGYSPQLSLDLDRLDPRLLRGDAYQPLSTIRRAKKKWTRGPIPLRGTRSPVDTDTAAYPPTFLTAAKGELLEPDIRSLTGRLHQAGRPVETHIWRRQVHAFPVLDGLLPESREAMLRTGEFLRAALSGPVSPVGPT